MEPSDSYVRLTLSYKAMIKLILRASKKPMLKEDILSAIPCLYKDDAKVFAVVGRVIAASFKCSKEGYISEYSLGYSK